MKNKIFGLLVVIQFPPFGIRDSSHEATVPFDRRPVKHVQKLDVVVGRQPEGLEGKVQKLGVVINRAPAEYVVGIISQQ